MSKEHNDRSRDLGLDRPITRRDLLHGISLTGVSAILPFAVAGCNDRSAGPKAPESLSEPTAFAPEMHPDYYPPTRTGLRGSHTGSFETAHAHGRDGRSWSEVATLDEHYDVIIVGGGISGLTAAFQYRKISGPNARILVLDNHDDFGGAAKRLEFNYEGTTLLAPGGSVFMETPYFSESSKQLIRDIGIDFSRLEPEQVPDLRLHALKMPPSICFDKSVYGKDKTIVGDVMPLSAKDEQGRYALANHIAAMPLPDSAKLELTRFLTSTHDVFEGMTANERATIIHSISYHEFVTRYGGLSKETADALFTRQTGALLGATTDSIPMYQAITYVGMPGLHLLGEQGKAIQKELDEMPPLEGHYGPDGNAIITRHLVKCLVPDVADAESMEELTTERFNYAALDSAASSARIRLNSTVINIENVDGGEMAAVTYVRGGVAARVTAKHCIYAGFHAYLPYVCPQLPVKQKSALSNNVRMPFVCASVVLRNGKPVQELGSASFYFPGHYLHEGMVYGRSLGQHKQEFDPDEPLVIYLIGAKVEPHSNLNTANQHRRGRHELLSMKFEDFEMEIREQLGSLFASTSFDVRNDIVGLTVNRWPHGYSRQYNTLFDPDYEEGQHPHTIASKRFGAISIANSDASYVALCNTAIDEGLRAVNELLT